jgi:hypothetical protein
MTSVAKLSSGLRQTKAATAVMTETGSRMITEKESLMVLLTAIAFYWNEWTSLKAPFPLPQMLPPWLGGELPSQSDQ